MIVFPLVATGVSAIFSALLFRDWSRKRRLSQLAWGLALAMFALASVTVVLGVADRWDPTMYRLFWLFGVMLNVPWLAVGSIALVAAKPVRAASVAVVGALSLYAVVLVVRDNPDREELARVDGVPRGSEVWAEGASALTIGRWYSLVAWIIVVGIALWSSRARGGMKPPAGRVRANKLIAVGVTIVAVGGFTLARIGGDAAVAAFSVSLATGVSVMFAGFLLAGRAPRYRLEDPGESPT